MPDMITFFGGALDGKETIAECAIRELHEETELVLGEDQLTYLCSAKSYRPDYKAYMDNHAFYARNIDKGKIVVHEGAGIYVLPAGDDLSNHKLVPEAQKIIQYYLDRHSK